MLFLTSGFHHPCQPNPEVWPPIILARPTSWATTNSQVRPNRRASDNCRWQHTAPVTAATQPFFTKWRPKHKALPVHSSFKRHLKIRLADFAFGFTMPLGFCCPSSEVSTSQLPLKSCRRSQAQSYATWAQKQHLCPALIWTAQRTRKMIVVNSRFQIYFQIYFQLPYTENLLDLFPSELLQHGTEAHLAR